MCKWNKVHLLNNRLFGHLLCLLPGAVTTNIITVTKPYDKVTIYSVNANMLSVILVIYHHFIRCSFVAVILLDILL